MIRFITYTTQPTNKRTLEKIKTIDILQDMREFLRVFPRYKETTSAEEYTAQTIANYKEFEKDGIIKNLQLLNENGEPVENGAEVQ